MIVCSKVFSVGITAADVAAGIWGEGYIYIIYQKWGIQVDQLYMAVCFWYKK